MKLEYFFIDIEYIGFYLYMLVVETFSADKIRLRIYALIGWGKFPTFFLPDFELLRLALCVVVNDVHRKVVHHPVDD